MVFQENFAEIVVLLLVNWSWNGLWVPFSTQKQDIIPGSLVNVFKNMVWENASNYNFMLLKFGNTACLFHYFCLLQLLYCQSKAHYISVVGWQASPLLWLGTGVCGTMASHQKHHRQCEQFYTAHTSLWSIQQRLASLPRASSHCLSVWLALP